MEPPKSFPQVLPGAVSACRMRVLDITDHLPLVMSSGVTIRVPYMKRVRGSLRVVLSCIIALLLFYYKHTTYWVLPQGDLRGDPCVPLEDLLHDRDCCLFMLFHHDDSIMDRENSYPSSCVCTSAISALRLSVFAHRNGLNARALSGERISCWSVTPPRPSPYAPA